ncbi:MAG TPA: hypothetical protein VII38_08085 [Polyangia bacterium]
MKPCMSRWACSVVGLFALAGFAACSNHSTGGQDGAPGGTFDGGPTLDMSSAACSSGDLRCSANVAQSCSSDGQWIDVMQCPNACNAGMCVGVCPPGSGQCLGADDVQACGSDGLWQKVTPCQFGCASGACRTSCNAGDFHCAGNAIEQCNPPSGWTPTGTTCDPTTGQKCDEQTGTCVTLTPTGGTAPTGTYYQFAVFQTGSSAFLGGYDVDSYGDYIYVNRGSTNLDQYKVTLLDSDGDGKLEPNQHPDNPANTGPIEQRTLTLVKTWTKAADMVPLGSASAAEIYAQADRVDLLGAMGQISEFMLATDAVSVLVPPSLNLSVQVMGHGDADGRWYVGSTVRRIYSYDPVTMSWVAEFEYPNLAGSHMDGMEVVVAPGTGEQYVYVSDMTSDFIAQYQKGPQGWTQVNLFKYNDTTSSPVEGMGFGALNHFWATSGTYLYELGGGEIQNYLQCPQGIQECGSGQSCPTGQTCSNGCCESQIQ